MYQTIMRHLVIACATLVLAACGRSNSSNSMPQEPVPPPTPTLTFRVSITNLSAAQPFSPLATILHDSGYSGWRLGEAASNALEQLAEGGDNSEMLSATGVMLAASGEGIIMPGTTDSIELVIDETPELQLTLATMLVNTNDGFTGVTNFPLSHLEVGQEEVIQLPVLDAGTELNMELTGTIPGPADGGVGYDAMRDDVNYVAMHPGVVSRANGYTASILDESHRFDAPIAWLTVTRME